jgi:thymidylate kinase
MPEAPPNVSRASTASEFFTTYFQALEEGRVPYVVLHGYERYPSHIGSDVDYAVRNTDLPKAARILRETCAAHDWAIAQVIHHTVYGNSFIAFDRHSITQAIQLDICSHFGRGFALFIKDEALLEKSYTVSGFHVPAPKAEFAYVLAKALSKRKSLHQIAPRLRQLAELDRAGCVASLTRLTGLNAEKIDAVCDGALETSAWNHLIQTVTRSHSRNLLFSCKELWRRLCRFLQPTGLIVGILGVDGSGKSTLIENLTSNLRPFYPRQHVIHFQPGLFRRRSNVPVRNPHAKLPRSIFASWFKVVYYFIDWMLGYFGKLYILSSRSTLIVCDRTFDDLVVDPKRYRLQASDLLAAALRKLLPAPHLLLVLIGPPSSMHARKPELTIDEINRQQAVLTELAETDHRMQIIDAGRAPQLVAEDAASGILQFMADRSTRRTVLYA